MSLDGTELSDSPFKDSMIEGGDFDSSTEIVTDDSAADAAQGQFVGVGVASVGVTMDAVLEKQRAQRPTSKRLSLKPKDPPAPNLHSPSQVRCSSLVVVYIPCARFASAQKVPGCNLSP